MAPHRAVGKLVFHAGAAMARNGTTENGVRFPNSLWKSYWQ